MIEGRILRYLPCDCGARYWLLPAWFYRHGLTPKRAVRHALDCPKLRHAIWQERHMRLCR